MIIFAVRNMLKAVQAFILFLLFLVAPLFASAQEQGCVFKQPASKVKWKSRVRVRSLQNFDDFLNWTIPLHMRSYPLEDPVQTLQFKFELSQSKEFIEWYGYFSLYDPLVGKVSKKKGSMYAAACLFAKISRDMIDMDALAFATDEALAKVMAYRDLKQNTKIMLPSALEGGRLVEYHVDHVFDLWHGMPAFGLVGEKGSVPILVFRGTDFSLDSERGWASLMSDVDIAGPGLTAFNKAREEIRSWLMKVAQTGSKAKVMGFSLGGALAAYTYLFEQDWVNPEGCVAFNPPGFSEQALEKWNGLSEEAKNAFRVYVNRGDVVSKIGKLFGDAYEISLEGALKPLKAHTLFLTAEQQFSLAKIDVDKENMGRRL
ncbi:MAG: hypothetical protein JSR39_06505 [Verrucomicrobia bacterium]|nr:hypothetical protein [Verrucomicrobiota bacterium]